MKTAKDLRRSINEEERGLKTIYVDQDGTLAKWRNVPAWVTKMPLYYLFLSAERRVIRLVKRLYARGCDVRVLTKAYEDTGAAIEKIAWLKLHGLGSIPVIIVPYSQSKLDYVESGDAVLLDDYSKNLIEWSLAGKTGIKFMNGLNGTNGTWKGPTVTCSMSVREMEYIVLQNAQMAGG